jgi:sec-independent protein translocase protein TatA
MIGGLGVPELLILLVLVLLVFGAGKLPKVAGQLGEGIRNFQNSLKNEDPDALDDQSGEDKKLENESD